MAPASLSTLVLVTFGASASAQVPVPKKELVFLLSMPGHWQTGCATAPPRRHRSNLSSGTALASEGQRVLKVIKDLVAKMATDSATEVLLAKS